MTFFSKLCDISYSLNDLYTANVIAQALALPSVRKVYFPLLSSKEGQAIRTFLAESRPIDLFTGLVSENTSLFQAKAPRKTLEAKKEQVMADIKYLIDTKKAYLYPMVRLQKELEVVGGASLLKDQERTSLQLHKAREVMNLTRDVFPGLAPIKTKEFLCPLRLEDVLLPLASGPLKIVSQLPWFLAIQLRSNPLKIGEVNYEGSDSENYSSISLKSWTSTTEAIIPKQGKPYGLGFTLPSPSELEKIDESTQAAENIIKISERLKVSSPPSTKPGARQRPPSIWEPVSRTSESPLAPLTKKIRIGGSAIEHRPRPQSKKKSLRVKATSRTNLKDKSKEGKESSPNLQSSSLESAPTTDDDDVNSSQL